MSGPQQLPLPVGKGKDPPTPLPLPIALAAAREHWRGEFVCQRHGTQTPGTNLLCLLARDDFSLLGLIFPGGFTGIFSLSIKSVGKGIFEAPWGNTRCFQESEGTRLFAQSQAPGAGVGFGLILPP